MNTKFKFGLTLAATLVLAACGSSGGKGGKDNSTTTTVNPTQTPVVTPVEDTPNLLKDDAVEFGGKFVKKNDSNLNVGVEGRFSASRQATPMTVELEKSLDTIIIASEVDINGKPKNGSDLIYLEDFDFRGNDSNKTTGGLFELKHIYKLSDGKTFVADSTGKNLIGKDRSKIDASTGTTINYVEATHQPNGATKTSRMGFENGIALVFSEEYKAGGAGVLKHYVNRSKAEGLGTVAEVYGYRTFVVGDSILAQEGHIPTSAANGELKDNNAPYMSDNGAAAGRLHNVQYGRVTSKLNKVTKDDLAPGVAVDAGGIQTYIASYGGFGEPGTENSYFYRGVDPTSQAMGAKGADLVAKLQETYGGKITYRGHAVTYGFEDTKFEIKPKTVDVKGAIAGVPNAIVGRVPTGSAPAVGTVFDIFSGTHVEATVDLNTYNVTGSLFNNHVNPADASDVRSVKLARFSGTLTSHGNVQGTSTRLWDGVNESGEYDEGSFRATLYGSQAPELGGSITSTETGAKSWGAVFGAKQDREAGLGVGTDSENRNK